MRVNRRWLSIAMSACLVIAASYLVFMAITLKMLGLGELFFFAAASFLILESGIIVAVIALKKMVIFLPAYSEASISSVRLPKLRRVLERNFG